MIDETPANDLPKCIWCGAEMSIGPRLCNKCNRFQKKWLNWIPNVPAFVALVNIAVLGLVAAIDQSRNLLHEWTWEDSAELWSVDTSGESMIRNTGDGDVVVTTVIARREVSPNVRYTFSVNDVVSRESVLKTSFGLDRCNRPMSAADIAAGHAPDLYVFLSANAPKLTGWRSVLEATGEGETLAEEAAMASVVFFSLRNNEEGRSEHSVVAVPVTPC